MKDSDDPDPLGESKKNSQYLLRLLKLSWQYRWDCIAILLLQLVILTLALSGLGFVGVGIDFIRETIGETSNPIKWPFGLAPPEHWPHMQTILVIAIAIFLIAFIRGLLQYIYTTRLAYLVQAKIILDLRASVYDKLQQLSFRFFDANASGSIINRVTGDVQAVRLFVDGVLMQSVILVLSVGVFLFYMLSIEVGLTLACMLPMPLIWILSSKMSRVVKPAYRENRELLDGLILRLTENYRGMQVVKGFGLENEQIRQFSAANNQLRDQQNWVFGQVAFYSPAIAFASQISLIILLGYGGYLVMVGKLPLGTGMVVFAGLLQQFSSQVANIASIMDSMQRSLVASRRVFEILDAPIDIKDDANAVALSNVRGEIEFENVSFAFKESDTVLHEVSFKAVPGECIAIVGITGSGKSALLSLISRFYDPDQGRVLVDGHDARTVRLRDLRRNVGLVFQESFIFRSSVAANIAFGHPNATDEQIETAAKIACAHNFIQELPKGYKTILGEGGADLSGGQRQRIAIARAILLDPSILILDDPTAAIDPGTENEILEAMDRVTKGRTTFVVAHRLSTLRRADRIIVLEKGRIVQSGTHEQLMNEKGHYQYAAQLQMADHESRMILGMAVNKRVS